MILAPKDWLDEFSLISGSLASFIRYLVLNNGLKSGNKVHFRQTSWPSFCLMG